MRLAPLLLLTLFAHPLRAQQAPPEEVDGARALAYVAALADDAMQGRKSGLDGGKLAEQWVAARLREFGLEPGNGDSWFHEVRAAVTEELPAPLLVASTGGDKPREGRYLEDFVTLIYSGEGVIEAGVVFLGYGIHAPDKGRDDYAGIDVKGKVVLALRGAPEAGGFEEERFIGYKSSLAYDRGAVGFMIVEGDRAIPGTIQEKYFREKLPAIWISRATADDLFARAGKPPLEQQAAPLNAGETGSYELDGVRVNLEVHAKLHRDAVMRNVVGLWPGETDEFVVLGAHLDHLGIDGAGNVYNGADDNASGSGMLLEIARAVAASGTRFKRGLLFVWFAGEEQGLIGAAGFVDNPPVPLEKIAVMLNTDMVGQGKPTIAVGGPGHFPRDAEALGSLQLDGVERTLHRGGGGSDHAAFMRKGVPAFFVHTQGPHPNYHTPKDDVENIKPELLQLSGRFVRAMAERAAQADTPFCRPTRYAEYLWHAAPIALLHGPGGQPPPEDWGVDLRVRWFDGDFNAIDAALTETEAKQAKETALLPGGMPQPLLRDLRPSVVLGLKGPAASRTHRPAHRLGVTLFAPFFDADLVVDTNDLWALAKEKPLLVSLEGAPTDLDPLTVPAPILVPSALAHAWKSALAQRKGWLATYRLRPLVENKPNVHAEIAAEILRLREELGADRLVVVPGDPADETYRLQAPTLHTGLVQALIDAKLEADDIRKLLGGNLVRLLEQAARKPQPK